MDSVGFTELLAGDVCKLGFGDEGLCLGSHELLFELRNLRAGGLLIFELLKLIGDLSAWVSTYVSEYEMDRR